MKTLNAILTEIPDLVAEVWATRDAPNPAPRADRHIRTPPGSKAPANLDAIDLLRTDPAEAIVIGQGAISSHLLDRLGMCCRMIEEERSDAGLDLPRPGYGDWSGVVGYLTITLSWWTSERGVAEDVEHDVRQVHHALERAARTPQEPRYRCDRCGWALEPQPGGEWMLCTGCHQHVPGVAAVREKLRKAKPMTAAAMEREWSDSLGLRADTINAWARRGWLTEKGRVLIDRKWRPVFEPWDVLQVAQRHAGGDTLAESG